MSNNYIKTTNEEYNTVHLVYIMPLTLVRHLTLSTVIYVTLDDIEFRGIQVIYVIEFSLRI